MDVTGNIGKGIIMKNLKKQNHVSFILFVLVVGLYSLTILGSFGDRSSHPEYDMVRHLSQKKDSESVKHLRDIFSQHALAKDGQVDTFLDAEVLLALQEMSTKEARVALRQTLRDIHDRGPKYDKCHAWYDRRYMTSMSTGIRLLGLSAKEEDKKLLAELANDDKLDTSLREESYYWMLIQKINIQNIDSIQKKLNWLYAHYTCVGGATAPAYKICAIERVVYGMGQNALPILSEYANELAEKNGVDSWGVLWLKHLADNIKISVELKEKVEIPGKAYWRNATEDTPHKIQPTAKKPAGMLSATDRAKLRKQGQIMDTPIINRCHHSEPGNRQALGTASGANLSASGSHLETGN